MGLAEAIEIGRRALDQGLVLGRQGRGQGRRGGGAEGGGQELTTAHTAGFLECPSTCGVLRLNRE